MHVFFGTDILSYYIYLVIKTEKTSTDQCSEGTYRNSDGECVSQCPCGYYGNAYFRSCDEGKSVDSYGNAAEFIQCWACILFILSDRLI